MVQNALEKKTNLDYLEKEIGWHKFFPKYFIETMKVFFPIKDYISLQQQMMLLRTISFIMMHYGLGS